MDITVEISAIDLRYQHCRLRHEPSEQRLLCSLAEQGIRDPLLGVVHDGVPILLDGFKRQRCAQKLGIHHVAFRSLADDEAMAIIALMRLANSRSLSFIEQARLIDELRRVHKLSVAEIARRVERSAPWVSARIGLSSELTPMICEKIMSGAFPMHAYLASIRPITRVNKVQAGEVEDFVRATAGKGLSVRELDILAKGYFKGGDEFRRHVDQGDVRWCLDALRSSAESLPAANNDERKILEDLEIVQRRIRRLPTALAKERRYSPDFLAEAHLLCGGTVRLLSSFDKAVREFYDRSRPEESDRHSSREGHGKKVDRTLAGHKSQHSP